MEEEAAAALHPFFLTAIALNCTRNLFAESQMLKGEKKSKLIWETFRNKEKEKEEECIELEPTFVESSSSLSNY